VDRLAHAAIVADSVFGERSIDLAGEPQWIVAIILGTGHSVVPNCSMAIGGFSLTSGPPPLFHPARAPTFNITGKLHEVFAGVRFREDFAAPTAAHRTVGIVKSLDA